MNRLGITSRTTYAPFCLTLNAYFPLAFDTVLATTWPFEFSSWIGRSEYPWQWRHS